MSITFYFAEDTQLEEVYECCDRPKCPHCAGTNRVAFPYGEHEVNMANGNAMILLRVLGLPEDYAGEIPGHVLARKATEAVNRLTKVERHERPTTITKGNGPTVIDMGLSAEQIRERLVRLQLLGAAAGTRLVTWG
jgi:hypothetical protein